MGVYVAVAKQSFRRQSTYRAAMIAGIFTNAVFGVILASVLLAAFESQTEINGLDANAAVTITFITQGMLLITRRAGARRTGRMGSGTARVRARRPPAGRPKAGDRRWVTRRSTGGSSGACVRSELQYRTSFAARVLAESVITFLDCVVILALFTRVPVLGGWDLRRYESTGS